MSHTRTVVFDNETLSAVGDVEHRKHRRVLAVIEVLAARNLRRAGSVHLVVPTPVRVEAGRRVIHDLPMDPRQPIEISLNRPPRPDGDLWIDTSR